MIAWLRTRAGKLSYRERAEPTTEDEGGETMDRNAYAVVTGASSGFGIDFARQLAVAGYDLVLVARREERLREAAARLEADFGRRVEIVVADLAVDSERERVAAVVEGLDRPAEVLVNNAGLGLYGSFVEMPWEKERQMIDVDVSAVVHLTKLFARGMRSRSRGFILNIASTAAYQPSPLYASYAAAKAFVLAFSQAVNFELRGSGVSLTVASPGIAATEFLTVSKQQPTLYQRVTMMQSETVVKKSLAALFARKATIVPGALNNVVAQSEALMPSALKTRVAYYLMRSNDAVH